MISLVLLLLNFQQHNDSSRWSISQVETHNSGNCANLSSHRKSGNVLLGCIKLIYCHSLLCLGMLFSSFVHCSYSIPTQFKLNWVFSLTSFLLVAVVLHAEWVCVSCVLGELPRAYQKSQGRYLQCEPKYCCTNFKIKLNNSMIISWQ